MLVGIGNKVWDRGFKIGLLPLIFLSVGSFEVAVEALDSPMSTWNPICCIFRVHVGETLRVQDAFGVQDRNQNLSPELVNRPNL